MPAETSSCCEIEHVLVAMLVTTLMQGFRLHV